MNPRKPIRYLPRVLLVLLVFGLLFLPASSVALPSKDAFRQAQSIPASCSLPVDKSWIEKVNSIRWVAYSSPKPNPQPRFYQPTADIIYKDLLTLKKANFTGLITYGSVGIMGEQFLEIAQSLGYEGVIMGIWNPLGQSELNNAREASAFPIVLGYSIGNEGLSGPRPRYTISELCAAIASLRSSTGRPVTTSEDIEAYYRWLELLKVGDWIFAISHPYWHFTKYPLDAIQWEEDQYAALLKRTDRYVFFKEVGLPSAGAFGLSEANQDLYYRGLAKTEVRFAYFEGFDQPSKSYALVEPHWGIFHSNLEPKLLGWNLMGYRIFTADDASGNRTLECSKTSTDECSIKSGTTMLLVGDGLEDRQYISVISFNTAGLPDKAVITTVKLRVRSAGIVGTNPISNRRDLVVDICTAIASKNPKQPASAGPMNCNNNLGTFDKTPNSGWYTVNLDPAAFEFINPAGFTEFRLRIDGNFNIQVPRAYIKFYSGSANDPNSPILIVKYYIP